MKHMAINETQQMSFFHEGNPVSRHILSTKGIRSLPSKEQAIKNMYPPNMLKWVHALLGLVGYYRKFIRNFTKIAKPLTLLTCQQTKFEWTPTHHNAFLTLKESVIQAPILHYPNPRKHYILYIDASDGAYGAQLSEEHEGTEFPIAFLSHIFTDNWMEMEYHRTRFLQCILCSHEMESLPSGSWYNSMNNHKPLARFLIGKNANNKVNR